MQTQTDLPTATAAFRGPHAQPSEASPDVAQILAARFVRDPCVPPLHAIRGEGACLHFAGGLEMIDASGGPMVVGIGHGRRELAEVAYAQLERLGYVMPYFSCDARLRLIERLRRWLPADMGRIFLTSGGSEALEAAIKTARQIHIARGQPERRIVIGRELSYHGSTTGVLAASDARPFKASVQGVVPDWPKAPLPRVHPTALGPARADEGLAAAEALETLLVAVGPTRVSAFIAEPIGGAMSAVTIPPAGYYERIREICDRHGVLFIADEVVTGFGRCGRAFAHEHWKAQPDMIAFAKGMSSGYAPIGGLAVRESLMERLEAAGEQPDTRFTFSGHPLACALAERVLEILEREALVARAAGLESKLRAGLEPLRRHPIVHDVRGRGALFAVQLGAPEGGNLPVEAKATMQLLSRMAMRGVLAWPAYAQDAAGRGDAIIISPPFVIDDAQLERVFAAVDASLEELSTQLSA